MTAALLQPGSDEARAKIVDNLREEVRDRHPDDAPLRDRGQAVPTDTDAGAVYDNLMSVRQFIGRLDAVPITVTMAFFEGFICQFMPYLAELAERNVRREGIHRRARRLATSHTHKSLPGPRGRDEARAGQVRERDVRRGRTTRNLIQKIVVNNAGSSGDADTRLVA